MKLLGSTKKNLDQDKDGKNVPKLFKFYLICSKCFSTL